MGLRRHGAICCQTLQVQEKDGDGGGKHLKFGGRGNGQTADDGRVSEKARVSLGK